ncbi:MAG: hypothetical protein HDT23_05540, partial [Ruminococcus sp.]|nr:hypothetical protein [Ruminococcus sp.]
MFPEYLFDNILETIHKFPPVVIVPAIIIIFIVKKYKNKIRMKKFCVIGFLVCIAVVILPEVIVGCAMEIIEEIASNIGGIFIYILLSFIVKIYHLVQAFCFTGGITLAVTYIILTIHKKKQRSE